MKLRSMKDGKVQTMDISGLLSVRFYSVPPVVVGDPMVYGAALEFERGGDLRIYFEDERHWAHTRDRLARLLNGKPQRPGDGDTIDIAEGALHWQRIPAPSPV